MVKVVGRHHVRAMRAFVRRKLAQQQGRLAREKEAAQKLPRRELPAYDPDDTGRFAGYDAIFKCEGSHYEALCRVLKKILRPAHYRTWAAANGELVNSPAPCLAAKEIAERVGRHRRTIEIDLQEMREKRLLHLQPAQREGHWVMEMHFDVLYRLVHEYLEWERSSDYIPPERQYFERIEISADLRRYLLQFEDYRKVLAKKKPGPKVKSGHPEPSPARTTCTCQHHQHTYSDASILPAAYQGGMTRSVNLELPAPPALPQAGVSESILPMTELEPEIRRLLDSRASKVAPAMPEENEIGMRVLSSEPEEDEPQEHAAQPEMMPVERYDDAPDRTANQEARDDREAEKLNAVALSSVFSYGSREIVHGGAAGAVYPAIVPLLRDFMQKKLLGGDTATRYFVAYERLGGPHIERAFPPGSNGVWLWRDRDQLVHVKPTCSSLDPALKNRNLSSLSVAVGKLADDDGRFYFAKPRTDGSDRPSTPPGRQSVNDDRTPRAAPPGVSPPDAYAARGDDGYNGKAPIGTFQAKIHRRRKEDYSGKGPPGPAQQQAQERYNALLKQAKDGRGKGLQRLF